MSLFLAMLPAYLLGNLHCFGMCGPLVMMIGRHRYRALYFIGRILSFTLVGYVAGSLNFILQIFLYEYSIGAFVSYFFGGLLLLLGASQLIDFPVPRIPWLERKLARFNQTLTYLILKDQPLPTFLFGFFTILLPCGQSVMVFSASALLGTATLGAINGLIFSILTSPSLYVAMQLASFFKNYKKLSAQVVGATACFVGILAILRGLAESNLIPHFILWDKYHIVLW